GGPDSSRALYERRVFNRSRASGMVLETPEGERVARRSGGDKSLAAPRSPHGRSSAGRALPGASGQLPRGGGPRGANEIQRPSGPDRREGGKSESAHAVAAISRAEEREQRLVPHDRHEGAVAGREIGRRIIETKNLDFSEEISRRRRRRSGRFDLGF